MTERILVAGGTPKMIVDKLEQWHFETGANGGFMLARGFSAPATCRNLSIMSCRNCSAAGCRRKNMPARRCGKTFALGRETHRRGASENSVQKGERGPRDAFE